MMLFFLVIFIFYFWIFISLFSSKSVSNYVIYLVQSLFYFTEIFRITGYFFIIY